jgi:hypothetical protein
MPNFSSRSQINLAQCHPNLQRVFNEVVKTFDCTIFTGERGQEQQDELFRQGKTKVKFPGSKHNQSPSLAVDAAPYPIDWHDRERASFFAGYVLGIASELDIELRWGGDWDQDWQVRDNNFDDLWHFELVM